VAGGGHPDKEVDKNVTKQFKNRIKYNNTDPAMVKVENSKS
jgi:hypothetical protein